MDDFLLTGFSLLTHRSFAYCPGAEQEVALHTIYADPAIYLGGDLTVQSGPDGEPHCLCFTTGLGWNRDAYGRRHDARAAACAGAYASNSCMWRMPDVKVGDQGEYQTWRECLYWRREGVSRNYRSPLWNLPFPHEVGIPLRFGE